MNINSPLLILGQKEYIFNEIIITSHFLQQTIKSLTNNSLYSYEREILNGYFTIEGGHRIGIAGQWTQSGEKIVSLNRITGINIRVSKDIKNIAKKIIPYIVSRNNIVSNTLIIAPPGCGKTTLLRDIIRNLSDGIEEYGIKGYRIVVIDERTEIANINNANSFYLGKRTFIIDGISKASAMIMAIRSLSPQIIATDELGAENDYYAICEVSKMGVKILATLHGSSIDEIIQRKIIKELIKSNIFEKFIILSERNGPGTIEKIVSIGDIKNGF